MAIVGSVTNQDIINALFLIAPQFKTDDPVILQRYNDLIDLLRCQVSISRLGCCAVTALAFLLAHYLELGNNPYMGISNAISEGQLSISMSSSSNSGFFNSSPYGQAYLRLIGTYRVGIYVANSGRRNYGPPCGC